MATASQYRDWTAEQKAIATQGAQVLINNGLQMLEDAVGISLDIEIYDLLLAGSFGSVPGYGDAASDFDLLVVVSAMPQLETKSQWKQVLGFARNQANVILIGNGFENSSNLSLITWPQILDRTNFGGSAQDITATSLLDGEEFKNAQEWYQLRLA